MRAGKNVGRDVSEGDRRNPIAWIALLGLVVALGLGSRRHGWALPRFVAVYAGDTLWATAAYLGLGLIRPRAPAWKLAVVALAISSLVEVSQFYHAPWIDAVRRTTLGGLILGFDFVWSDLACYAAGVALGLLIEGAIKRAISSREVPGRPRPAQPFRPDGTVS